MQVQAVVHAGAGENMMNQMANILSRGEGAPSPALDRHRRPGASDQAQVTRHKRL